MRTLTRSVHPKNSGSECSLKVRECKNLRNMPKLRFQRRQRVSQAKKRYNCYTEKNNSIEVDIMET